MIYKHNDPTKQYLCYIGHWNENLTSSLCGLLGAYCRLDRGLLCYESRFKGHWGQFVDWANIRGPTDHINTRI